MKRELFNVTQERAAYLIGWDPPGGGRRREMVFHLRYPDGPTIRRYFESVGPVFRLAGDHIEHVVRRNPQAAELLIEHLEKITDRDGAELASLDEVRGQLRSPRADQLVNAVVNGALFSCEELIPEDEESSGEDSGGGDLFADMFRQRPVHVCVSQFDLDEKVMIDYPMRAKLMEPTLEQRRQYEAARPITQRTRRKKGASSGRLMEQEENVHVISSLFDSRVVSVEGAVYRVTDDGKDKLIECGSEEAGAAADWPKLVPYHVKSRILQADAGFASAGNE